MFDISKILESKKIDNSRETMIKVEMLCNDASKYSNQFFESESNDYSLLDKSIDLYTKAADLNSKYSPVYVSVAMIFFKLKQFDDSLSLIKKLLSFDAQNLIGKKMMNDIKKEIQLLQKSKKKEESSSAFDLLKNKLMSVFSGGSAPPQVKIKVSNNTFKRLSDITSEKK